MGEDGSDLAREARRNNAILRARIRDARNDVVQWRELARSNQELFYLDEMYECLAVFQQIAEARRTGLQPDGGEEQWKTHVNWFLEAYEGAKDVRGQALGWHLSCLVGLFRENIQNVETEMKDPKLVRIGQNIGKFRDECNWTYDVLAAKTGIDRKQIISHVQGRVKPRPKTLEEYAEAFTKKLGRKIAPTDLKK